MSVPEPQAPEPQALEPLPYHAAIRQYLKTQEPEVWQWYASHQDRAEQADAIRFELLKSTYRVDRESQAGLYEMAAQAARRLGLDLPVTLYQAQNPSGLNASLAYAPGEAHIVFHGPVTSRLDEDEVRALLAHELSHVVLWQVWDGDLYMVDQILAALTHDRQADVPHFASARLFGLYNEVFCDRGALAVAGRLSTVVAALVKMAMDLDQVNPSSYLQQADEIFAHGDAKSVELTHPEAYIRARALRLWHEADSETEKKIEQMISGPLALEELDLLGQQQVAERTRRLIDQLLVYPWFQTDLVLSHARLYFNDYAPPAAPRDDSRLARDLETRDGSLAEYYCFVLLDFVTADRSLDEAPLAAALQLAEQVGLKPQFTELARRELRLRKKQLEKVDREKAKLLAAAK